MCWKNRQFSHLTFMVACIISFCSRSGTLFVGLKLTKNPDKEKQALCHPDLKATSFEPGMITDPCNPLDIESQGLLSAHVGAHYFSL